MIVTIINGAGYSSLLSYIQYLPLNTNPEH